MKNFFGSIFINRDKLYEAGINYPIKVEYRDKIGVEHEKMEHITNDEKEITEILGLMKGNEVTPIGLEDVVLEIKSRQAIAKNKKMSYNT